MSRAARAALLTHERRSLLLELLQRGRSFKARGAFHKLLRLTAAERAAGVVAVSGGNHGIAVADAAGALGIDATVVMPASAPAIVVPDADAVAGIVAVAEQAKLWVEPAAGCLVPAARRVLDRVGPGARLGLVVCGGNVTFADVAGWVARFGLAAS